MLGAHDGEVSCKGEAGFTADFPEPKIYVGDWWDLECQPPFAEDESGSNRCPPRGKLYCLITFRLRPSEHRDPKRDSGGLLSSTINWERSLAACKGITTGFSSGIQGDSFTCMGGFTIDLGRAHGVGEGVVAGNGTVDPGVSSGCASRGLEDGFSFIGVWGGVGFACTGVWDGVGSGEVSCILESDSGEGAGRSNVDAAQSQWDKRAPKEFR